MQEPNCGAGLQFRATQDVHSQGMVTSGRFTGPAGVFCNVAMRSGFTLVVLLVPALLLKA